VSAAVEARHRAVLAELADLMLPGAGPLPSAREVGLAQELLDRVLAARPDLAEPLAALLEQAAQEPPAEALARIRREDPAAHDVLGLVVAGGYLMSPRVGEVLRYPGQQPKPVNPFDINDVVEEGLLDPVVERGAIYRPTPGA
jgi:hypothetical protein